MKLIQVKSDEDVLKARELFEEYAAWLGINLCFQNFDRELSELPGQYSPPYGRLFLATQDNQIAGCVALRKIFSERVRDPIAEMKRLYVRPQFRGQGLGRSLTEAVIEAARAIGFRRIRLDTIPGKMDQAMALYHSLGFKNIEPYYINPVERAAFMELEL